MKTNKFVLGAVFTLGILLLLGSCATTKPTGLLELPEGRYEGEGEVKDGLAAAAQKPRVTVIPFDSIGLSKSDAQSMTLLFEASLQNTGAFLLIEQVEATNILEAQEYSLSDCVDELCAIEIGRLLSADQIVLGTVGKVADLYYMTVKIIDVQTGRNLIAKKEQDESLSALVRKLDSVALLLADEADDGSDSNKVVRLELPEGRYEGTVKDGKPHGQGILHFIDDEYLRETYEGTFKEGILHGSGTIISLESRYEGEVRDGRPNGWGTYFNIIGERYEGEFKDGRYHGEGILHFADDNEYTRETWEGTFKEGVIHGFGTMTWVNGNRYEGEYMDDRRNGQATFHFADGARYEGEFRDSVFSGQGTLYWETGDVYTGEWADNQPIGGSLSGPNRAREWVTDWWF